MTKRVRLGNERIGGGGSCTARDTVAAARSAPTGQPEDPQTAIRRMLKRLPHHDYALLAARGWTLRPASAPVTARQLGVSAVHVQRQTPRAYARLHDLLAEPAHAIVGEYATTLRARLGSLTQEHTARSELNDLGLDIATDLGQLLLHLAGPFTPKGVWLESATGPTLVAALATLDGVVAEHKAPTTATLRAALTHLQVAAPIATKVLDTHPTLRRFGDKWVRWGSDNADKVEAVLHLLGKPATPADVAAIAGDALTEQSARNALGNEPQFTRTTKQTWALREWGLREYTGVYAEISTRLKAASRPVSITAIVDEVRAALPDVAESSIRTYLNAPGFVVENGTIRHRRDDDGWPKVAPLNTIRGAFHDGTTNVRYAIPVTAEVLRGSGITVSGAVATALGVNPGHRRTFTGPQNELTLTWLLSVTNGASFGSLRGLATTLGALRDDTIVLAFTPDDGTVTATLIAADADTMTRLRMLVGKRQVRNPIATLSRALQCTPDEVIALLTHRGENDLLTLLREPDS
ncbi:hypothetical protein [Mycolicibacterium frederiksbergense]|uniref:Uncharacterized protein n=1 Tax=Mycolicibacterium frederiksbergense TaxID=117567 RepID=A0A6H0S014_9MYCO|nr:hypothetical protein [Mycolicibacterium frederiksbergense]QIV79819.1 hypothetical protein EXE63_01970 [Mycolicibacterium frederiksbergense]